MTRPRLPEKVAAVTGADKRSPGRFRDRKTPVVRSLGPAPVKFTEDQAQIWDEFNDDFPWLGRTDRRTVGLACILQSEIDKGDAPLAAFAQLRLLLSSMGGTPVDRSKVNAPDEDETDPSDEFLN